MYEDMVVNISSTLDTVLSKRNKVEQGTFFIDVPCFLVQTGLTVKKVILFISLLLKKHRPASSTVYMITPIYMHSMYPKIMKTKVKVQSFGDEWAYLFELRVKK